MSKALPKSHVELRSTSHASVAYAVATSLKAQGGRDEDRSSHVVVKEEWSFNTVELLGQ